MGRSLTRIGIAVGVVLLVVVAMYWRLIAVAVFQPQMFSAPSFDLEPPEIGVLTGSLRLLAFSKTNGYRHHSAIPAAQALLDSVARENGWSVYHTENAAVFNNAQLALFDVVILNNSSGTVYLQDQQDAFRSFVEGGGGVVALHAAGGDSSYVWGWYARELIRAQFVDHPMANHIQEAALDVEELAHPVVMHLGRRWVRSDEWYNFAESPASRVNVLLSIDESTYDPESSPMGEDHPMVWWHQVGAGRVLYCALGHVPETYTEPEYAKLLAAAVRWVSAD